MLGKDLETLFYDKLKRYTSCPNADWVWVSRLNKEWYFIWKLEINIPDKEREDRIKSGWIINKKYE